MHEEPLTRGKVVIKTTLGDLDVELWSRECPLTCKNFIQLCLEGYYKQLPFHRLIPGFLIQTGDPTGTGVGGESSFGKPFNDEFSTRLKFAYRGLLGMASSKPNDNRSQFFITFNRADALYKKHTLFGKVVGDTIYNLLAMEKLETDRLDRPTNPPIILETIVQDNPFTDIFPRDPKAVRPDLYTKDAANKSTSNQQTKGKVEPASTTPAQSKQKRPLDKRTNLLSFGDEEEEQETVAKKIVCPHDLLKNDPTLVNTTGIDEGYYEKLKEKKEAQTLLKDQILSTGNGKNLQTGDASLGKREEMMKKMIQQDAKDIHEGKLQGVKAERNERTGRVEVLLEKGHSARGSSSRSSSSSSSSSSQSIEDEELREVRARQKDLYEKMRFASLQFKQGTGTTVAEEKPKGAAMSAVELKRYKFLKANEPKGEEDVLAKLDLFRKKLHSKELADKPFHWMNAKLKFHTDSAKAYSLQENKAMLEPSRQFQQSTNENT